VERGNADALAEAILRLLSDENLSQEMGKAGRQRVVDKFSWEQISETLLVEFHKICDPTC
jgi:glycosyltransferase involved in cell wall biosynthesis